MLQAPWAGSSMQDDLSAERVSEVDWINGEVVQLAKALGGNAPVNQKLIELIKQAEKRNPPQSLDAHS